MLVIECTVIKNCPKGSNLADLTAGQKRRVQTSTGETTVTDFVSTYIDGRPFSNSLPVVAPVDLLPGDAVLVEAAEYIVYRVYRGGNNDKPLYENKAMADGMAADLAARKSRQDFLRAMSGSR